MNVIVKARLEELQMGAKVLSLFFASVENAKTREETFIALGMLCGAVENIALMGQALESAVKEEYM